MQTKLNSTGATFSSNRGFFVSLIKCHFSFKVNYVHCWIVVFAEKLHWFRINKQEKNFEDMPELTEVSEQLSEETRKKCEYLIKLRENLDSRLVKMLLYFPSSCLVECGFSAINKILTKERNKIDISIRGDNRLKLTNLKPNVEGLVPKHQPQGSR